MTRVPDDYQNNHYDEQVDDHSDAVASNVGIFHDWKCYTKARPSLHTPRNYLPHDCALLSITGMEWKASHILIKSQDLARKIQTEIKKGARFEEMARKHSTCPSKSSGGDLGWFGPGKMVKAFEDACRKTGVGTVTDPVRTQFGYHLIKVTGKK